MRPGDAELGAEFDAMAAQRAASTFGEARLR